MKLVNVIIILFLLSFAQASGQEFFTRKLANGFYGLYITNDYWIYMDSAVKHNEHIVPTITSYRTAPPGYAIILSKISAEKYWGKRIEFTAWVKTKNVTGWAGLNMRVDAAIPYNLGIAGFDNMYDRPIKGTTDWTRYFVILDVPPKSIQIVFGALLTGEGQIWFDYDNIKIVSKSISPTRPCLTL